MDYKQIFKTKSTLYFEKNLVWFLITCLKSMWKKYMKTIIKNSYYKNLLLKEQEIEKIKLVCEEGWNLNSNCFNLFSR